MYCHTKEKNRREKIWLAMIVGLLLVCGSRISVQAKPRFSDESEGIILVSNQTEFYDAISWQIREHKSVMSYDTYENAVGSNLQEICDGYYFYHNVDNLVDSGSYLHSYLEYIELESWHGDFTGDCNYRIEVRLWFKYEKQEMDNYFQSMHELAAQLKKESDLESVKAVHDYLIKHYDYDYQYQNYLDYEGYLNGTMVCQGYCMAAFYLLAEMHIPVRIVVGSAADKETDNNHAWNVVYVDGNWYNMDVTWDDEGGWKPPKYTFFLKNDADFYKHTREGRYDYDKDMAIVSYPMHSGNGVLFGFVVVMAVVCFVMVVRKKTKEERQNDLY